MLGTNKWYDSVHSEGEKFYIVYKNCKAYPAYAIEFSVPPGALVKSLQTFINPVNIYHPNSL